MYKRLIGSLWLLLLAFFLSLDTMAQGPDPGPPPVDPDEGGPPLDPDAEVPFDGGLSMLLAAGAAYGAKKAVDYRKAMKATRENG